ncbi:MAG: right-handed parallel beta-helix repeat-containing protein [Bacteroidales bacterium]|nr:right-handed parallel beta-helix repeat-containing protein [Bacteroidales bacterium]
MKRLLLPLLLLIQACAGNTPEPLSICDYGAKDGEECTTAIQAALDACSAQGGGRVIIPAGTFLSSTLYLRDQVELYLEEGAVLQGVADPDAYQPYIPHNDLTRYDSGNGTANANCVNDRQWMKAFIIGDGVTHAAISGPGTIDGSHVFDERGEENMRGPHTIIIAEAADFRMQDVHITRASNYAFLGYALQAPVFEGVTITEGWDGIHIRGAKDAVIRACSFQTGDDSIAGGYWENMLIEYCEINSSCNGIRIIMPCDRVIIRNSRFYGPGVYPHRTSGEARRNNMLFGVSLEPGAWGKASGTMQHILLQNLTMENLSSPVATSVREGSVAQDLTLKNISASGITGALTPIVCWNDLGFRSITVQNCTYTR